MEGEEALLRLKAGNLRFARGESLHPHLGQEWRRHLGEKQHPFATVLGCSGSQAPPELVFDQGLGDLFVIRVAGNIIAPEILGSIQYAGAYLRTRLFVVFGHEGCGVVRTALEEKLGLSRQAGQIEALMRLILPALRSLDATGDFKQQLSAAVEANVRWTVRQLRERPEAHKAILEKQVKIVGAICQPHTGEVRFLED